MTDHLVAQPPLSCSPPPCIPRVSTVNTMSDVSTSPEEALTSTPNLQKVSAPSLDDLDAAAEVAFERNSPKVQSLPVLDNSPIVLGSDSGSDSDDHVDVSVHQTAPMGTVRGYGSLFKKCKSKSKTALHIISHVFLNHRFNCLLALPFLHDCPPQVLSPPTKHAPLLVLNPHTPPKVFSELNPPTMEDDDECSSTSSRSSAGSGLVSVVLCYPLISISNSTMC